MAGVESWDELVEERGRIVRLERDRQVAGDLAVIAAIGVPLDDPVSCGLALASEVHVLMELV